MIKIVKFYADWCGPCKILKPVIDSINSEHPEVEVVEINIDQNMDFTKGCGVMSVPTVIVYKDDVEVMRKVGVGSKALYEEALNIV